MEARHVTQDATSSALGFYYQGCYALVAILDSTDDTSGVAVETYDDVFLEAHSLKTLSQLKHKASPLSIKSDDFWKAIANWCAHIPDPSVRFRFVLTSRLPANSLLRQLIKPDAHQSICDALREEASRVCAVASATNDGPSFKRRLPGCQTFMALTSDMQMELIGRLDVHDASFDVTEYGPEVARCLGTIPLKIRTQVADRLIEWWDRQVSLALGGLRSCVLRKSEVLDMISEINKVYFSDRLPDDYADKPPPDALDETPVLVQQIKLIDGHQFWISRAKQERWRARGQRDSWLSEQLSVADRLIKFDNQLITEWRLRFEPIAAPISDDSQSEKRRGQDLFRWALNDAWREVPPIQPEWKTPYLVRGTYQELANRRLVGWHPRFDDLLGNGETEDSGDDR
jgi:hypothetical protein